MTYSEFVKFHKEVMSLTFVRKGANAIEFGMERTAFVIGQLERIIEAAESVPGLTVKGKIGGWKRQLKKAKASHKRFKQLHLEQEAELVKMKQRYSQPATRAYL